MDPPAGGGAIEVGGDGRPQTFSALICAYSLDRWAALGAAVASLRAQRRRPDEIILVVDHNPALLERAIGAFRDVRCVPNAGSPGLSASRNTGVRYAAGDVIGFLDDDALAAPDWVERLMQAYVDERVLGVGGWLRPRWLVPRPGWLPDEFLWVVGCSYAGLPTSRAEVRNPIGANMSFRRDVFAAVGGFEPRLGRVGRNAAGCEETEFAIRVRRAFGAGRILLEPNALCEHAVGADRVTRPYFRQRCVAEGRSKALISMVAGSSAALSVEQAYLRRTLPRAIAHGLRDAWRGDLGGATRAWTILEGTALTAAGFLRTRCLSTVAPRAHPVDPHARPFRGVVADDHREVEDDGQPAGRDVVRHADLRIGHAVDVRDDLVPLPEDAVGVERAPVVHGRIPVLRRVRAGTRR